MGGKKHKKKIFTTPKVIPHTHTTKPLAALKFYGVDNENNIILKRFFCPSSECGAGICMASHSNRYYCGKCNLTIFKDTNEMC
jgi:small subunit ribosomal protein S27Ae